MAFDNTKNKISNMLKSTEDRQYITLSEEELMEAEGGIGPITAGLIVLGTVYGSGVFVGFMGG